ncbi:sulfatase family protein [Echinicola salinicaeni]|uniref:sulfatase family protein n=1 Tax=Echinicola salinicaeni TaxID=2762757 RepID=UPI00164595CD|nr:arylsulfatase [Echinicola salinicaeni]
MNINSSSRLFVLLISLLSVGACNTKQVDKNENKPPNIVLILADDLGYGDVVAYNADAKVSTPNIDQLADGGMMFTDAHSPSSVCTPTRYGILTGRYSWRTRLKKGVLWPWDEPLIEENQVTMPQMLKQVGYQTAAIGKWHLGWNWATKDTLPAIENGGANVDYNAAIKGGPLSAGFDYYFGDDVPNFPPYTFIENERVVEDPITEKPKGLFGIPGAMAPGWTLEHVLPTITQKSVKYIEEASGGESPFFLYFALTAPHTPIAPTEQFKGTSQAGAYGDFVQEVDWTVGQIMDALERSGVADNTIFIFTSDNGSPARNGKNYSGPTASVIKDYGHKANGDLRGLKGDAWEGGHRLPFIVRWPGNVEAGSVNEGLVSSLDIMATIRDILEIDAKPDVTPDGVSLKNTIIDNNPVARDFLVHHSHQGVFAIRKGEWKLILSQKSGGFSDGLNKDGYGIESPGQLYNLKEDPEEMNNLYEDHPDQVKELTELLNSIKEKS